MAPLAWRGGFEMDWRLETGLGRQGCRGRDVYISSLGGLKELAFSYLAKKTHTTKTIFCMIFSTHHDFFCVYPNMLGNGQYGVTLPS